MKWAVCMEIIATEETLSLTIEIFNSYQVQFATIIIANLRIEPSERLLIVDHVEQTHFVATQPSFPYPSTKQGGHSSVWELRNTCSINGPMFWLI